MIRLSLLILLLPVSLLANAGETVLFDGKNLDSWTYEPGGWVIESDGSMVCQVESVKAKDGTIRHRGKGYIWTKKTYQDFELSLSYKLTEAANSGVFFRTDRNNPVQGGFEIQLLDNEGFQKVKGAKDTKNLNGAFYDCQAALADPAKGVGTWNRFTLRCKGSIIEYSINGVKVNRIDIDRWDMPNKNPDGSSNKFKTALKDLPRKGHIGFQNHGNVVWFKDVTISEIPSR